MHINYKRQKGIIIITLKQSHEWESNMSFSVFYPLNDVYIATSSMVKHDFGLD